MNATYVSVWDDGVQVRANCQYENGNVTEIDMVAVTGLNICTDEYIELPDGTVITEFKVTD